MGSEPFRVPGFGHKPASGFLNLAAGRKFLDRAPGESMDQPPTLLDLDSELGQLFLYSHEFGGPLRICRPALCD